MIAGSSSSSHSQSSPSVASADKDIVNPSNVVEVDDSNEVDVSGKRQKRCTSIVWQYFTKKEKIVEIDGKKYNQMWGHCNFPNCKAMYRAESYQGTSGFINHLRTAHSIVKGQQQLKADKDHGTNLTLVQTYKYDQEDSLKKFYLAIIMHEYPFQMAEHNYFVDFIKSLRPSFPLKSRVTVRNDIMDLYLEEKKKLYAHLKTVECRFSTTMDMWTSRQNISFRLSRSIPSYFTISRSIPSYFARIYPFSIYRNLPVVIRFRLSRLPIPAEQKNMQVKMVRGFFRPLPTVYILILNRKNPLVKHSVFYGLADTCQRLHKRSLLLWATDGPSLS
jgi:hypothetical protein